MRRSAELIASHHATHDCLSPRSERSLWTQPPTDSPAPRLQYGFANVPRVGPELPAFSVFDPVSAPFHGETEICRRQSTPRVDFRDARGFHLPGSNPDARERSPAPESDVQSPTERKQGRAPTGQAGVGRPGRAA